MIVLLAGLAGVGKTEVLQALRRRGERVIDLEALARHRGSVFGATASPQPRPHRFARCVRDEIARLEANGARVWLEDEGPFLGRAGLPPELYTRFRTAPIVELQAPRDRRIRRIVASYGALGRDALVAAATRLAPRLESSAVAAAIAAIEDADLVRAASILLAYYDAGYQRRIAAWDRPTLATVDADLEHGTLVTALTSTLRSL